MRYFPTIVARGREEKKVPPNVSDGGAPKGKVGFYALRGKGTNG